jgi:hypothetical protein
MADSVQSEKPQKPAHVATMAMDAAQVFISHSSPDASLAAEVCNALERDGQRCWIASRDVVPGELYADGIVRAISPTDWPRRLSTC